MPCLGTYDESRSIGQHMLNGGAPNNFLHLRNEKLTAPFGSTVKKGWLHGERGNIL